MVKLDYTLKTSEERKEYIESLLSSGVELSAAEMDYIADYLVLPIEKKEKKEHKILTDNRLVTINKRETSYEGLVASLEAGEDGIYNIAHEDKNVILTPKVSITKKDLAEIPLLSQLKEAIDSVEAQSKDSSGHKSYILKRNLIDLRRDQYLIKDAYRRPIKLTHPTHSRTTIQLDSDFSFDESGDIICSGVSLGKPEVCKAILHNYSILKQDSWGNFENDLWYLINDFESICDKALENYPEYMYIVESKIDGLQNIDIQAGLLEKFGKTHTPEYISALWCNKIPKLIAEAAKEEMLNQYYLSEEKGTYKRCSCCGQIKLAHKYYFSKNSTSKDGFYSICKACRNEKNRLKRLGKEKIVWQEL